jgi:hypothetical protein
MESVLDKKLFWPSGARLKNLFRLSTSSQDYEMLLQFLLGFQWTQIPEPSGFFGQHSLL